MDNIEIFADMLNRCKNGILKLKTAEAVRKTKIYQPDFVSGRVLKGRSGTIGIEVCGTLEAAWKIHMFFQKF